MGSKVIESQKRMITYLCALVCDVAACVFLIFKADGEEGAASLACERSSTKPLGPAAPEVSCEPASAAGVWPDQSAHKKSKCQRR